jgi:hypothetical protein
LTRLRGRNRLAPVRSTIVLLALAAALVLAAPAAAKPRVSVTPNPVDHDRAQTVTGRGWPVIEFCKRAVRISLRSAQNAVTLGTARVRRSGRFRFSWTADDENVGAGRWRLVARMMCESGSDGSPNPVRRSVRVRVR